MNFSQIRAVSVVREASQAEIDALSGSYVEGRFYEVVGSNELRRALNANTLSLPIVFGTSNVDALAGRVTTLETNALTKSVYEQNKTLTDQAIANKVATNDFVNYQSTVTNALAEKLGKLETAANSTLFNGLTHAQVIAAWKADDSALYNTIMQAVAADMGGIFAVNFTDGQAIDASKLDVAAGVSFGTLKNRQYMFVMNGPGGAKASVSNYAGSDAAPEHQASNNDTYVVTLVDGAVTTIARKNDVTSEALVLMMNVSTEHGYRISTLEATTAENGITKIGNKYVLGGTIAADTTFTGQKFVNFQNTLVADDLRTRDIATGKVYRLAVENGTLVYGEAPLPN